MIRTRRGVGVVQGYCLVCDDLPVAEQAALQIGAQLAPDEAGQGRAGLIRAGAGEEGFQVFSQDAV